MANLNKVMLIGRLTRDPEVRTFANGGKVAKFGFAVNNRKKNSQTGQWEEDPVFLDVEAFNRGETGRTADLVEQYLHRGNQCYVEGHLVLDQWTQQDGTKRSKIKIVVDNVQFLEPRPGGAEGGPRYAGKPGTAAPQAGGGEYHIPTQTGSAYDAPPPAKDGASGDDIPF